MEKLNRLLIVLLAIKNPREVYPFGNDSIVAETAVKNYRFMNEVADVIKSTGKITDAGKDILANSDCFYEIRVSSLVDKDFGGRLSYNSLPFYPNGSYMLSITYADFSSMTLCGEYMFKVNNLRFVSKENLFPYFTSCKKDRVTFRFGFSLVDRPNLFWYIFIINGRIDKAYYMYAEYDDPAYNIVYDLFTGKTMTESEYMESIENTYK